MTWTWLQPEADLRLGLEPNNLSIDCVLSRLMLIRYTFACVDLPMKRIMLAIFRHVPHSPKVVELVQAAATWHAAQCVTPAATKSPNANACIACTHPTATPLHARNLTAPRISCLSARLTGT
jgi:hypothetical protein